MMLQNKSTRWIIALVSLMMVVLAGCGNNGKADGGKVVATYEGGQVIQSELDTFKGVTSLLNPQYAQMTEAMDPNYDENMLKQLSGLKVIVSKTSEETRKEQKELSNQDFKSLKTQIDASDESKKQWKEELKVNGINEDDVLEYVIRSNTASAYMSEKVTDEQVQTRYEELLEEDQFKVVTVSHILIMENDPNTMEPVRTSEEALERVQEVKAKLDDGGDFAALAKEYSDDPGSKDTGGTYEDRNVNMFDPAFAKAALEQPLGEVGDPVESSYGYHIIKVEARADQPLEEVETMIVRELMNMYFQDFLANEMTALNLKIDLPKDDAKEAPETGDDSNTSE